MPGALTARDLLHNPRLAVHSPTADPGKGGADWPGEAKMAGVAVAQPDCDGAHVFSLDLTEVVWTGSPRSVTPRSFSCWHPGRASTESSHQPEGGQRQQRCLGVLSQAGGDVGMAGQAQGVDRQGA